LESSPNLSPTGLALVKPPGADARGSALSAGHSLRRRVRYGPVELDPVTLDGALEVIERLVASRQGGAVFTANIDHVVKAARQADFREAYGRADLVLCDGQPLVWLSPLVGQRVPEKVSGSDLLLPLLKRAAARGFRVFLLGGAPGVVTAGAERLRSELGVDVVGWDDSVIGLTASADDDRIADRIREARPDLVLAFLGAPKSELFSDRVRDRIRPAVVVNLGASLDFYLGRVRRAPRWMQRAGVEWLYRLLQEPRRLARRYLVDDVQFLPLLWRTIWEERSARRRR